MLLGTEAIKQAMRDGAIVCDPDPLRVEGAHVDVAIGAHYWVFTADYCPTAIDLRREDPMTWFKALMASDRVFIPPQGFILAHTEQFIGTAPGSGLLPVLHTRSTLARWGLGCHPSAGWGDEGFCSRWTLEIINPHPVAVAIPVGARVGCVSFHRIEGAATPYEPGTRYNATQADWTPEAMLPKRGNW